MKTKVIISFFCSLFLFFNVTANAEMQEVSSASGQNDIEFNVEYIKEYAEIGQPFPIEYSITGGSGKYSEILFDVVLCTGSRLVIGGVHEYVDAPQGTWNMVAPQGTKEILYLSVKDAETGEKFRYDASMQNIEIRPNPDYPVSFSFDKSEYEVGEEISVQYSINELNEELAEGEICWVIRKNVNNYGSYDYEELESISSTASSGMSSISPQYGTGVFFKLKGTTQSGEPIYAESELIPLQAENNVTENDMKVLKLPQGLKKIEQEAFAGVLADKIIIPASVEGIENHAFYDNPALKELFIMGNPEEIAAEIVDHTVKVYCRKGGTAEAWALESGHNVVYIAVPAPVAPGN